MKASDLNDTLRSEGEAAARRRADNARRYSSGDRIYQREDGLHETGPDERQSCDNWPEPDMRLVDDDGVLPPQLENDALPAGWVDWIAKQAKAHGAPRDYVAAPLIGMASGWIGNARRLAATADWAEPAVLWFAQIGTPSSGKTPPLIPMMKACRQLERAADPEWRKALAQYERDAEAAKERDRVWRDDT